jgi:YcxB-like protein
VTVAVSPIVVDSTVRPSDHFRVAVALVLRNPASLALFVSGPLLWAFGAAAGSNVVIDLGERMSWLVLLVPLFAGLVGSYSAYRPGSGDLYAKTRWTFGDDRVVVEQPARTAGAEWGEFVKWRESGGCYLLHTGARDYVVVPVRDVPTDRRADFESLLAAHLGAKRG